MTKTLMILFIFILVLYTCICGIMYITQESLIFYPQRLAKDYQFNFDQNFEELNIKSYDGISLNGLLFKADSSKGLIFYLHGNAGSLSSWGAVAETYTDLNYDVFMLDYRAYGKSEGIITSENQLFQDMQTVYDELKKKYKENNIIVLGYSIGSGFASKIAATNNPKLLILQAPYFSLTDMMSNSYPFLPNFILKYKLTTNEFVKACKMPIVVFHGDQDDVIYYGSSLKLKKLFKKEDILITLHGQAHNGMTDNPKYKIEIRKLLSLY